jgi:hypothetical protein
VAGGGGPGAGSSGEARALERRGQRGVETGGRVEQRERGASDSVVARERGKEREKVGVPAWRLPRGAGVPWGLASTGGWREGADGWAAAQCQAGLACQRAWGERGRTWAGPRRNGDGPLGCTVRFCIYLN